MPDEGKALRFLADMGVSWRVVEWLRSQGYDAKHLRDEGLARLEDAAIFAKAREKSRIVLSFDLDFGEIAAFTESRAGNIVVFRLRNARTSFVIERLSSVLNESSEALTQGAVVAIEDSRHRIRRLPIGKSGDVEPGRANKK
jgi:predicted nuclease of predicted toxin-antitoxin system